MKCLGPNFTLFTRLPLTLSLPLIFMPRVDNRGKATRRTQRAVSGMRTSSDNHGNLKGISQPISAWSPPDRSSFKVNVDASWNATTKKGNVAMVIRDSNGKFVAARKLCISASSIQVAEAKAILEGCMLAKNLELDKIIMESDLNEVILSLCNSTFNGRWDTVPVVRKILHVKDFFQLCSWSWVPRSANIVADRLASSKNSEIEQFYLGRETSIFDCAYNEQRWSTVSTLRCVLVQVI